MYVYGHVCNCRSCRFFALLGSLYDCLASCAPHLRLTRPQPKPPTKNTCLCCSGERPCPELGRGVGRDPEQLARQRVQRGCSRRYPLHPSSTALPQRITDHRGLHRRVASRGRSVPGELGAQHRRRGHGHDSRFCGTGPNRRPLPLRSWMHHRQPV